MKFFLTILFLVSSTIFSNAQTAFQHLALRKPVVVDNYSYKYTGAIQKYIVPNKVTSLLVKAVGAKGGTGGRGQVGGAGANISTTLNVTPGQVLYIVVGGYPGQSATAKYGFGGNGGASVSGYFGGAGGGLSGVFTSSSPANSNALVAAGGGGGGAGINTGTDYTGGAAANTSVGNANDGNEPAVTAYIVNGKYQKGYAATISAVGSGGNAFDAGTGITANSGNDIRGGAGGSDAGVNTWNGGGGGGAGFFGGGSGAGGGGATGGGAGGSTKTSASNSSFGVANTIGDGSVSITALSNSGLVLHLDAGNTNSYSGSGSTWNDLTGLSSAAVLNANVSYSPTNGGNLSFNGTSAYTNFFANIGNTNVVTVEMWVKINSLNAPTGAMLFGFSAYDIWTNNGCLGFNTASGDLYGISSSQVSNLGLVGSWKHLVFVMKASSYSNNKIYVDGISQSLTQQTGSINSANAVFNSGNGRISSWLYDLGWVMNEQVANFKVYNRELTQQEITNNFNANRAKFYAENDGKSPGTASTSAYQIKQDYPSSTDGFYWIKNANINGGIPFKIYADMTTDGGGWTLVLKNSNYIGWTYANAISLNTYNPFNTNAEITNISTSNYSIVGWADYIKKSASGFQYMFDAGSRGSFGGIWTANGVYSFVKTDNTQTDITLNSKFGNWNYVSLNNGMQERMPWYSNTAGSGDGILTISSGTQNWWGTLISKNINYTPAPWISDAGGGTLNPNPGIIWYWVR